VCDGEAGSWRSGAVWKRPSGPQIRLLLPDLAADPAATDAMLRDSDLDCDQYAAADRDWMICGPRTTPVRSRL